MFDHLPHPFPEVLRSLGQRLADVRVDFARDPRLLFGRHLHAEVIAGRNREDFELHAELLTQLLGGRIIFLAEQPSKLRFRFADVVRVDV